MKEQFTTHPLLVLHEALLKFMKENNTTTNVLSSQILWKVTRWY